MGVTYRIDNQTSTNLGAGYNWGSVRAAGASATVDTALATIGGRYGFSSLDAGPYAEARADAGWVDYQSKRALGGGLGTALGSTGGAVFSGLAGLGKIIHLAPVTITPQTGLRVTGVTLGSFNESGSDLALGVNGINDTSSSVLAGLEISLDRQQLDAWTIEPSITLGYERLFGNPQVESTGTLYGIAVSQNSAYDSRDLIKAGLGVTAQHDAFIVKVSGNAIAGDGARSTGISGQLSIRYNF